MTESLTSRTSPKLEQAKGPLNYHRPSESEFMLKEALVPASKSATEPYQPLKPFEDTSSSTSFRLYVESEDASAYNYAVAVALKKQYPHGIPGLATKRRLKYVGALKGSILNLMLLSAALLLGLTASAVEEGERVLALGVTAAVIFILAACSYLVVGFRNRRENKERQSKLAAATD